MLLVQAADVVADARFAASLGSNFSCLLILWITSTVSAHRRGKRGERWCRQCRLMARSGRAELSGGGPLSGEDRTRVARFEPVRLDDKRTY